MWPLRLSHQDPDVVNVTGSQGRPDRDVRALESPVNLDPVGDHRATPVRRARDIRIRAWVGCRSGQALDH